MRQTDKIGQVLRFSRWHGSQSDRIEKIHLRAFDSDVLLTRCMSDMCWIFARFPPTLFGAAACLDFLINISDDFNKTITLSANICEDV
jgi:hypothetical protein